jgi:O-antigen/teichoic acid export membrane protein
MVVSPMSCLFYHFAGLLLTCTSILALILTFRYFVRRYRRRQKGLPLLPLSPILIGMLISLMMILCTGIPLVLIQCFTCRPLKTYIGICKINAFICFSVGTFNM